MKYLTENTASALSRRRWRPGKGAAGTRRKASSGTDRRGRRAEELASSGYDLMSGSGRSDFIISVTCFSFCPSMSFTDISSETKLSSQTALSPS